MAIECEGRAGGVLLARGTTVLFAIFWLRMMAMTVVLESQVSQFGREKGILINPSSSRFLDVVYRRESWFAMAKKVLERSVTIMVQMCRCRF